MSFIVRRFAFLGLMLGLCIILVVTARMLGQRVPGSPTYLDMRDCPMPCWNYLRPGGGQSTTLFWAVLDEVKASGGWMYSGQPSSIDGTTLSEFQLTITPSNQIRMGDVMLLYGPPEQIRVVRAATLGRTGGPRRPITELVGYWWNGYVQVTAMHLDAIPATGLSPEMPVREIRMRDPNGESYSAGAEDLWLWCGFGNKAFHAAEQD